MRELVPTQGIPRGTGPVMPLISDPHPLGGIGLHRVDGTAATVDQVLDDMYTDAAVVVHGGRVVLERYTGETGASTPHLTHVDHQVRCGLPLNDDLARSGASSAMCCYTIIIE